MDKLLSLVRPENMDLAIPPLKDRRSGLAIKEIMQGYSRYVTPNWERAANAEFRAGANGPCVGLLAQGGKIWSLGDPRWPVFVVSGTQAEIRDYISESEAKKAKFAVSAGPWLVRAGQICNITQEIERGGYTGLRPAEPCERAAIGIRADGLVVHRAWKAATLDEIATEMRIAGCANAINLDGGGSMCVLDKDANVLLGSAIRQVCSALVFLKLENESATLPIASRKHLRIFISPSQQPWNVGVGDYGNEQQRMFELGMLVAYHLTKLGCSVAISRRDQKLKEEVIKSSNAWHPALHLILHSNAYEGKGKGTVSHWYPGSVKGRAIAEALHKAVGAINPHGRGWFAERSDLIELSQTDAPAVYLEVGFHDNEKEAKWIVENMGLIARTIADTVVQYLSA